MRAGDEYAGDEIFLARRHACATLSAAALDAKSAIGVRLI